MHSKADFSKGSIPVSIIKLSLPILLAEFVHITYNIVDRVFIGHITGEGTYALSGVGIVFPLITFSNAFAAMCSTGGAPLCSIALGQGDVKKAKTILETTFTLLLVIGLALMVLLFITMPKTLVWMGADELTYIYASSYFKIYILGTVFVLISLGLNSFINLQGDAVMGMCTVVIGAAANIILDPIFMFKLNMGIKGAAWATVISQFLSALWATIYLFSRKNVIYVEKLHIDLEITKKICSLGISGLMFRVTNSITQAVVNITLRLYGGAMGTLYISAMSIINSVREAVSLPNNAVSSGFQPVASYNYGAHKNQRVCKSIKCYASIMFGYSTFIWLVLLACPQLFISLFTPDKELIALTIPCFRIYFAVFFMMSMQVSGQHTYVSLNCPKRAVFFSLLRKIILILPLTLLLPKTALGVKGVFFAECISQLVGASCCFVTMYFSVYRKLKKTPEGVGAVF